MKALSVNQKMAIKKLEKLRVGALFMEPGTGKTRTALELIKSSKADFVLFIVPFQTKQNLIAELKKWNFNLNYRIEGVESLSNSDRLYLELLEEIKRYKKPFMVVDESLKIKNSSAKRTKRVIEIGKKAFYKLILNGTPISKNILDLYPQMEFLSPKILNMNYMEYWNNFVVSKTVDNGLKQYTVVEDNVNIDYLYSVISPYVFEAKLNLEIEENEHEIEYFCYEPYNYQQIKQEFLKKIEYMGDIDFLAMSQKMQHSYSLDEGHIKACENLVSELQRKSIIFVKFIDTKKELQKRFPQCKVLTYGKGSLGLNLQEYKNIIFYDKTWDYAQLEQAKRRVYRLGQAEDVNYYFLTGNLGLENMINDSIDKKQSLLHEFKASSNKKEFTNGL